MTKAKLSHATMRLKLARKFDRVLRNWNGNASATTLYKSVVGHAAPITGHQGRLIAEAARRSTGPVAYARRICQILGVDASQVDARYSVS